MPPDPGVAVGESADGKACEDSVRRVEVCTPRMPDATCIRHCWLSFIAHYTSPSLVILVNTIMSGSEAGDDLFPPSPPAEKVEEAAQPAASTSRTPSPGPQSPSGSGSASPVKRSFQDPDEDGDADEDDLVSYQGTRGQDQSLTSSLGTMTRMRSPLRPARTEGGLRPPHPSRSDPAPSTRSNTPKRREARRQRIPTP